LKARPTDKVIYSTDIIPGNEQAVYKVIDQLSRLGLSVVYQETTGDLHVSGHAAAVEQQLMMELVNPRYLYPIGGSFRHMYRFKHLAGQLGFEDKQCLLPETGQAVEFSEAGQASLGEVLKLQLPRINQNG
jgi:ribonuclease J